MFLQNELYLSLLLLLFVSAFFSSSETALFSLGRTQRSRLRRESPIFGLKVLELLGQPSRLLGTILFGNMLANVLIFSLIGQMVKPWLERPGSLWPILAILVPIVGVLLVGEVLPKTLALCFPFRWSLITAYPLFWFMKLFSPIVNLLTGVMPRAREEDSVFETAELEKLVDETTQQGVLAESEVGIIKDLIRFGVLNVQEVMVPRAEMVAFNVNKGREALQELFESTWLTKIPVYEKTLDEILGVIYLRDFVTYKKIELRHLIRPLPVYPEQMALKGLYQRMRRLRQKTALIVDEYGGTAGVLTFKDILEEIVGEFNENLAEPNSEIKWLSDDSCEISATMALRDFNEISESQLPKGPYITVGGCLLETLGRMPRKDEVVKINGFDFEVIDVQRSKLLTLKVNGLQKKDPSK